MERREVIKQIKNNIAETDFLMDVYAGIEDTFDYSTPVLKAAIACELMLDILLDDAGIEVDMGCVIDNKRNVPALFYCANNDISSIPHEIKNLINVICLYRNRSAHAHPLSKQEMEVFNKAFDAFKCWFYEQTNIEEDMSEETREWYITYIDKKGNEIISELESKSLDALKLQQMKRIMAYMKAISNYQKEKEKPKLKPEEKVAKEEYKQTMQDVVGEYASQLMEQMQQIRTEINARFDRVDNKLDNMSEAINELASQISSYQLLVQNQIDLAITEEEVERIVQAFANTCVDRIVSEIDSKYSTEAYTQEEEKLKASLGESAWGKLSKESKSFLVSSKVTYSYLVGIKTAIDYSGVCLLVTKALEVEMKKRFFGEYMAYMKSHYPGKANYDVYPTALISRQYHKPLREKEFTLGTVAFVLCHSVPDNITEEQHQNDVCKLVEFSKAELLKEYTEEQIIDLLDEYGEEIAEITKEYRNKAAHTNELKRVNAEQCFELVLDVEKLLKRILDSFNH